MACLITISSAVGTLSGGSLASLTVTGTAPGCTNVKVQVIAPPYPFPQPSKVVPVGSVSGDWSAVFSANDLAGFTGTCGSNIEVVAECTSISGCGDASLVTIECCPTVELNVAQGGCEDDGTKLVTVSATLTPPPNGAMVQADLILDGQVVASGTSANPVATLSLSWAAHLASGSHSVCVQVNQPACGTHCQSFQVACGSTSGGGDDEDEKCWTGCKQWLCPLLFITATWSLAVAFTLAIFDSAACLQTSANLANVATWFLVAGVVALGAYYLICARCQCEWLAKTLWRILFPVGVILLTFAGCCNTLVWPGVILIAVALYFLWRWATECRKTTCQIVREAILVVSAYILPLLTVLYSLGTVATCLLVIFQIGSFPFTVADLVLIILFSLLVYEGTSCSGQ